MKNSPSCLCCEACVNYHEELGAEHSEWSEVSGDWTDDGAQGIEIAASDAQLVYVADVIEPDTFWSIQAQAEFEYTDINDFENRFRLIFGWEDSDNFWYAEFEERNVPGVGTFRAIRIVEVISGTHNERAEDNSTNASNNPTVCYENGVITAYFDPWQSQGLVYDSGTTIGGAFGLGTGQLINIAHVWYSIFDLQIDTGEGNCECP